MITVVTGLPRSGTSLMMQILNAGGMEILTDNVRISDINNPKGYFEFEKVKSLQTDNSWIAEVEGKAVKVIVQLIQYLPAEYNYNCIMMERNIDEILLSQERMIENLGGKKSIVGSEVLKKTFEHQLKITEQFILNNSNFKFFKVNYNELLSGNTEVIEKLNADLKLNLDLDKSGLPIDNSLYRNRIKRV